MRLRRSNREKKKAAREGRKAIGVRQTNSSAENPEYITSGISSEFASRRPERDFRDFFPLSKNRKKKEPVECHVCHWVVPVNIRALSMQ
jgi:hypothetical protein